MQVKSVAECSKRASAILLTFIMLTLVFKTFVLSIFEYFIFLDCQGKLFVNVIPLVRIVNNVPQHEISNNVVCATSKGSDQPAHTRSLIRAFASRLSIL